MLREKPEICRKVRAPLPGPPLYVMKPVRKRDPNPTTKGQTMSETLEGLPKLATAQEVAEATGLTLPHLWKLCRDGKIPVVRVGLRAYRFHVPTVLEWIKGGGSMPGEK